MIRAAAPPLCAVLVTAKLQGAEGSASPLDLGE